MASLAASKNGSLKLTWKTGGDLLSTRVRIKDNLERPMREVLNRGTVVTAVTFEQWRKSLETLITAALRDVKKWLRFLRFPY